MNLWNEVMFLINSFSIGRTWVYSIKSRNFWLVSAHFGYFIVNFHVFEGPLRRSESVFDRSQSPEKIFGPFFFYWITLPLKIKNKSFSADFGCFVYAFRLFFTFLAFCHHYMFHISIQKGNNISKWFLSRFWSIWSPFGWLAAIVSCSSNLKR